VVEEMVKQYQPLGILLVGSYANGRPGPDSDLDVYIIVTNQDWRERGNYYVDGMEIEYFINPVRQIRAYFRKESHLQPHSAHMLSTGIILYQQDAIVETLVKEAQETLNNQPPLEGVELDLLQYAIDDLHKDLKNFQQKQDSVAYQITASRGLERIITGFLRYHRQYMEKSTLLEEQLQELDPEFATLVRQVVEHHYNFEVYSSLVTYIQSLVGRRQSTWKLSGSLNL